jgi:hypothetical protein
MDSQIDENLSFAKYQTGNACHVSHPEKSKSKKNDHHKSGVNFLQNLAAEDIIYARDMFIAPNREQLANSNRCTDILMEYYT